MFIQFDKLLMRLTLDSKNAHLLIVSRLIHSDKSNELRFMEPLNTLSTII